MVPTLSVAEKDEIGMVSELEVAGMVKELTVGGIVSAAGGRLMVVEALFRLVETMLAASLAQP
jgi:hypothetical protein